MNSQNLAPPTRRPRIATIGTATWQMLPEPSPACAVLNGALTLSGLGSQVSVRTNVGDDDLGRLTVSLLSAAGIDIEWVMTVPGMKTHRSDHEVSVPSPIDRPSGVSLVRGDRIDIARLFGHDVVLFDIDDMPLLRFLVDLPAHTLPSTRLIGTLVHIATESPVDAFELMMRHDVVVGTPEEFQKITNSAALSEGIEMIRSRMRGENLRAFVFGPIGSAPAVHTVDETFQSGADLKSSSLDAFTGAVAFGMALRWDWSMTVHFATYVANLSVPAATGQARYPTFAQVIDEMNRITLDSR